MTRRDREAQRDKRYRDVSSCLLAGFSQREILRQCGVSRKLLEATIDEIRQEWRKETMIDTAAIVDQELMKLRHLWRQAYHKAHTAEGMEQVHWINTCLKISERVMKTLGLERHPLIALTVNYDGCDNSAQAAMEKFERLFMTDKMLPPIEGELASLDPPTDEPEPTDDLEPPTDEPEPNYSNKLTRAQIKASARERRNSEPDPLQGASVVGPDGSLREGRPSRRGQLLPVEEPDRPSWERWNKEAGSD